jgi:hypothetical protein
MPRQMNRREVIAAAASTAVAAVLPVVPGLEFLMFEKSPMGDPVASDADDLGIYVPGCGSACDCNWYMRADCAWGRMVRKLGDKFIIYDRDNKVIGEADPGFAPLPHDAEWIAKVEYARAHKLPHPYDWPKEKHEA